MSDRGPDEVKSTIRGMLDKFLDDDSQLKPVVTKTPAHDGCRAGGALRAGQTGHPSRAASELSPNWLSAWIDRFLFAAHIELAVICER